MKTRIEKLLIRKYIIDLTEDIDEMLDVSFDADDNDLMIDDEELEMIFNELV